MSEHSQVRYWVYELPKIGRTTFSIEDAESQFPGKPKASVRRALARLSEAGRIHSVWKGFYAISLPEYGINGIAPPLDYIDQLMRHLNTRYYVALLTAAAYTGAAHHAPQVFYFISDSNLHAKSKFGVTIEPIYKKAIPEKYITEINSRSASVKISSPELTAIDLVAYVKRVGGISHVATVLAELSESMDFQKVDADFFNGVSAAAVQRLGYVLDEELEKKELAESLFEKAKQSKVAFNAVPLIADRNSQLTAIEKNKKWNVIVNYRIENDL